MTDVTDKLRHLSPEKRALLTQRLRQQRAAAPTRTADTLPAITPDAGARHEPFPLTDIQQAYWVGRSDAFETGKVATHSYLEIEGEGLDLDRLAAAWRRVIARHDMLRARFLPDGTQQVLASAPAWTLPVIDLRGAAEPDIAARWEAVRHEMSHQVLPMDQWPLFDIRAVRLPGDRTRLHIGFDGLILDGWSMSIVLEDWGTFYAGGELPSLELTFRDYVLAEKALEGTDAFRRAREYWQARVATMPPAPDIPLAANAATVREARFVRRSLVVSGDRWRRLTARAAEAGLTSTGLLLAAYAEVLGLWSRSRRFTINVPRFNRLPLHPEVNGIAGEFAALTLLEVDNTGDASFRDRARRLQERMWEDLDHAAFGGVRVLRELALAQNWPPGTALMPVVFTSVPRDADGREMATTRVPAALGRVVYRINQSSQVWLDLHAAESADALYCEWDAVDDVLPDGMAADMLAAFETLLGRLADDPATWDLSWAEQARGLLPEHQLAARDSVNAATAPIPDVPAQQLFFEQAARQPDRTAIVTTSRRLSYGELRGLADRWARRLTALGVQRDGPVAIVMEKGWEQAVAVLGICQAGAPYVPIDAEAPSERIGTVLAQAGATIVLTQARVDERTSWPAGVTRLRVDTEDVSAWDDTPIEPRQRPDDLAFILFTSGSTGTPKGVMIEHGGVVNALVRTLETFDIGPDDGVLAVTALHHDMSVFDLFGVLGAGGTVVIPDADGRRDPAHWADLMRAEAVTVWNSVPAMMEMLLEYAESRAGALPPTLRTAFLGGDWVPLATPARLAALVPGARVVSVGGPTETTLWNIWYPVETVDPEWKSIPYGRPIANVKYHVLHDTLVDCPTWVPGELCCAGVGLTRGYWRDEERTRARFAVHPRTGETVFRTGDMGRYLPDGTIEFVGRLDFQVKIQGQRIELGDIEAALQQHPDVRAAVAAAVGEPRGRRRLVAYIVGRNGTPDGAALREFLLTKLPEYMVPATYVALDRLPLSANGKIDRRALPEPVEAKAPAAAPASAGLAGRIGRIVREVLGLDHVDPDANLLSYGANSIDIIRIGNQLEKQLGLRPRMAQLFRLQSVAAMADHFAPEAGGSAAAPAATPVGDPELAALIASYPALLEPAERDAFKDSQPGIRRGDEHRPRVQLVRPPDLDAARRAFHERRSHRSFSLRPVPSAAIGQLLHQLAQLIVDGKPKYLYASPGGLYPGQVYLHVKPGRVEGVGGGTYYYHPIEHALVALSEGGEIGRDIHIPYINAPIYDECAFSIFLVTEMGAIAPSYGDRSIHFATLEAGIMAHTLEAAAPKLGIGLCQIGSVDFARVRELFRLERGHVLLHSLLGGRIPDDAGAADATSATTGEDVVTRLARRVQDLSPDEVRALLEAKRRSKGEGGA